MASDHANEAAALAAGFKKIQVDRGLGKSPRYQTIFEKPLVGEPGASGFPMRAQAEHDVQATADANALAALQAQRKHRYAFGAGNTGKGAYGGALTDDLN